MRYAEIIHVTYPGIGIPPLSPPTRIINQEVSTDRIFFSSTRRFRDMIQQGEKPCPETKIY